MFGKCLEDESEDILHRMKAGCLQEVLVPLPKQLG